MPSPFPGMDPFIESQKWSDFHHEFISNVRAALIPRVRPRYVVDVEHYVFLSRGSDEPDIPLAPDIALVDAERPWPGTAAQPGATATMIQPIVCTLPIPQRKRQGYLMIRDREYRAVVTVLELLSPWNKSPGDGMKEYLTKRSNLVATEATLVEVDLLRGGIRLPTVEALPAGDYHVFICRRDRRPAVDVYSWPLVHRLPTIPVPLAGDDPDVLLDLQSVFDSTYDRAGYDYALNYEQAISPPLRPAEAQWVQERLTSGSESGSPSS